MSAALSVPVIETPRLVLRALREGDYPAFAAFIAAPRSRHVRAADLPPGAAFRGFAAMAGHWVLRGFGPWAVALKGADAALGAVGGWQPETWPEREITWEIWSAEHEGKGYAEEATRAARDHLYRAQGWAGAVSYIDADNARSLRLAARLGCRHDAAAPCPAEETSQVWRHPAPEARP